MYYRLQPKHGSLHLYDTGINDSINLKTFMIQLIQYDTTLFLHYVSIYSLHPLIFPIYHFILSS